MAADLAYKRLMAKADQAKAARVQIRIDRTAKQTLERAATLSNTTVSGFVVATALDAASRLIRERERLVLSNRAFDAFAEALSHPPKANAALKRAFARHRRLIVPAERP